MVSDKEVTVADLGETSLARIAVPPEEAENSNLSPSSDVGP